MAGKLTPDHMMSASLVPAMLGVSPWKTRNELLNEFMRRDRGEDIPREEKEMFDWGNTLEPIILNKVRQRLGLAHMKDEFPKPFIIETGRDVEGVRTDIFLGASLDGEGRFDATSETIHTDRERGIYVMTPAEEITVTGPGCIETKLTSMRPTDYPPPWQGVAQLQAQLYCTGYTWGAVAILYQGIELRIFVYERDEAGIAAILDALADFQSRRFHSGEAYPLSNPKDGLWVWPVVTSEEWVDLSTMQGATGLVKERVHLKESIASHESRIEQIDTALMEIVEDKPGGYFVDEDGTTYRAAWPVRKYKAKPRKIIPAEPAKEVRQKTLSVKVTSPKEEDDGK